MKQLKFLKPLLSVKRFCYLLKICDDFLHPVLKAMQPAKQLAELQSWQNQLYSPPSHSSECPKCTMALPARAWKELLVCLDPQACQKGCFLGCSPLQLWSTNLFSRAFGAGLWKQIFTKQAPVTKLFTWLLGPPCYLPCCHPSLYRQQLYITLEYPTDRGRWLGDLPGSWVLVRVRFVDVIQH